MLFLPCLSRSPLCSISFGTTNLCVEPHPLVSLLQDQLSFLSVCAVANLLGEPPENLPVSGICTPWGVAFSALAAAFSSGKIDTTRMLWAWQAQSCTVPRAAFHPTQKPSAVNAKAVILWMTALSCEWPVTASHKLVPLKPASPARPPRLWEQHHRPMKPEHLRYSNRMAKP